MFPLLYIVVTIVCVVSSIETEWDTLHTIATSILMVLYLHPYLQDVFTSAAPVSGGIGMFLLQKMGWKHGEGLGKNNEGQREPLMLDFKVDRKGKL